MGVTSGRRRTRSGGVTVAELFQRRHPTRVPVGAQDDSTTAEATFALAAPRITMFVVAVLCLCSAATAISVITVHATAPSATAATPPAVSGADALRPDLIATMRWPFPDDRGLVEAPDSLTGTRAARPDPPSPQLSPETANPAAGSAEEARWISERFIDLLGRDPDAALDLLAPRLLGTHQSEVAESWAALRGVRLLESAVQPDGTVVTRTLLEHPGNGRSVLVHRFAVEPGPSARVLSVSLLAARHSPG